MKPGSRPVNFPPAAGRPERPLPTEIADAIAARIDELVRTVLAVSDRHLGANNTVRWFSILFVYAVLIGLAFHFAYELAWDFSVPEAFRYQRAALMIPVVACKLLLLYSFGQFRSILSYFGLTDLGGVILAAGTVSALMYALWFGSDLDAAPPRGVILIDMLLTVALLTGFRLGLRVARTRIQEPGPATAPGARRAAIIGAGDLGQSVAKDLLQHRPSPLVPVLLVDDDPARIGRTVHGLPVHGPLGKLPSIARLARIEELLIALPGLTPARLAEIVDTGRSFGAATQIIPSFTQLVSGGFAFAPSRPVRAEDVLGRVVAATVQPDAADTAWPPAGRLPSRIHLSPPHLSGEERAFVEEAFRTNWIAPVGPHVDAFEREFCAQFGFAHAAALSSGTAALHLALRLTGIRPGDEVVCSTLTFAASANPILYEQARPVFIDADAATWNLDAGRLEEWLEARARTGRLPRAVIAVDLYGQCPDLAAIAAVCERHGVTLIEDAAEALGATCHGRPAGAYGRMAIFSFNGNKLITTSGGGMLVSNEEALIQRARHLATQARDPAQHYQHSQLGYNYRLSNVLAGIGRGQLGVVADRVAARRRNFELYAAALADLPGVAFMPEAPYGQATRWLTCLTIDPAAAGVDREIVHEALARDNIESRPVWKPLHLQPVFAGCETIGGSVAERLFNEGLCLPSGSALTDMERARVISRIRQAFSAAA